jgi:hypothetical protein
MSDNTLQPQRVPYVTPNNELIIPLDADPKYLYWKGGQTLAVTLAELDAPLAAWKLYLGLDEDIRSDENPDHCRRCHKPIETACQGKLLYCPRCNRYREEAQCKA